MAAGWPQSPYIPSAGAPPGAAGPGAQVDRSWSTLGSVCIVLPVGQLAWFLYTLGTAVLALAFFRLTSGYFGSASGGLGPEFQKILDSLESFARTQAIWEIARSLPIAACSVALIVIGIGIRKGRRQSLMAARTWVWFALAIVAVSLCIQLFVTIPASLEYQRLLAKQMQAMSGVPSAGGTGAFDRMNLYNIMMSVIAPLGGSLLLAAWPIALRIWTDKLLRREQSPPA